MSILIKKYSNRRLYHTEEKRYITMDDVANIIRQGKDVSIVDNETKDDITQEVLMQIIFHSSQGLFSVPFMHQLLRLPAGHLQEFFQMYFRSGVEYFQKFQEQMTGQMNLLGQMWKQSWPPHVYALPKDPTQDPRQAEIQAIISEYKKRIAELETQLGKKS